MENRFEYVKYFYGIIKINKSIIVIVVKIKLLKKIISSFKKSSFLLEKLHLIIPYHPQAHYSPNRFLFWGTKI